MTEAPGNVREKEEAEKWMRQRLDQHDVDSVPIPSLASAVSHMLAARAPSLEEYRMYVDSFITRMYTMVDKHFPSEVKKLKKTKAKDQEDWERYKDEGNLAGFVVPDEYVGADGDYDDDDDFEPDDNENYEPSSTGDDDQYDDDFITDVESDFEPPSKKLRGGGGIYIKF